MNCEELDFRNTFLPYLSFNELISLSSVSKSMYFNVEKKLRQLKEKCQDQIDEIFNTETNKFNKYIFKSKNPKSMSVYNSYRCQYCDKRHNLCIKLTINYYDCHVLNYFINGNNIRYCFY